MAWHSGSNPIRKFSKESIPRWDEKHRKLLFIEKSFGSNKKHEIAIKLYVGIYNFFCLVTLP
jgi:hypothetical protein